MVSGQLRDEILAFIEEVGEPLGIEVDIWSPDIDEAVQTHYLPIAHARDEDSKRSALVALRSGWRENQNHAQIRKWGRAAINIALYCLAPTALEEIEDSERRSAVDAVVRFSGWYHTDNNLWIRFQHYAEIVVDNLWGEIDVW